MPQPKITKPNLLAVAILLCFLSSCGSGAGVQDYLTDFTSLFLDSSSSKKDDKKKSNKRARNKTSSQATKKIAPKSSHSQEIILTKKQSSESAPLRKKTLKKATQPKFRVEAPVDIKKRIGGVARFIQADPNFIYLDFAQHFAVYNHSLDLVAKIPVSYPVKAVKRVLKGSKNLLYLTEDSQVLEILELKQSDGAAELIEINSFEVDGPFYWVNKDLLAIFLADKIQFLDFNDPSNTQIIQEPDIGNVNGAYLFEQKLYLARGSFLDVLDLDSFTVTSSIKIGEQFNIEGPLTTEGKTQLLLSLQKNNQHIGIQLLELTDDKKSIRSLGDKQLFDTPLVDANYDLESALVAGATPENSKAFVLYSITHQRFLHGTKNTQKSLYARQLFAGKLYAVSEKDISVFKIVLNKSAIEQARFSKRIKHSAPKNKNAPLAQIGINQKTKPEFRLSPLTSQSFMADSQKVILFDTNTALIFESAATNTSHKIFTTKTLLENNFGVTGLNTAQRKLYTKTLTTDLGLFAYSQDKQNIDLIDGNLTAAVTLPLKVPQLISWCVFQNSQQSYLALSLKTGNKKSPYEAQFYKLVSPSEIPLVAKISFKEPTHLFYIPDNQLITLSPTQMRLYNATTLVTSSPKTQKKALVESIELKDFVTKILAAKLSPSDDTVLLLANQNGHNVIWLASIFDIKNRAVIKDIDINTSHFEGSSFSKFGRLFILPSPEGTLFYDITDLTQIKEVAHWPLPSEWVDVANRGQFICVALGSQGVYCGDLLF